MSPKIYLRGVAFLIAVGFIATILADQVPACNPAVPILCQAYSRAEAVFVGKLVKVEKADTGTRQVIAHFSVKKVYKGDVAGSEVVHFGASDCDPTLSEIGKDYIVFKEPYRRPPHVANLTSTVLKFPTGVEYAEARLTKEPVFEIAGRIDLRQIGSKPVGVAVGVGSNRHTVTVDKDGFFSFTAKKNATYEIEITLPFNALTRTEILGTIYESEGTSIRYSVTFKPNECDYREFYVQRPDTE